VRELDRENLQLLASDVQQERDNMNDPILAVRLARTTPALETALTNFYDDFSIWLDGASDWLASMLKTGQPGPFPRTKEETGDWFRSISELSIQGRRVHKAIEDYIFNEPESEK
jgi:hypothetical protein